MVIGNGMKNFKEKLILRNDPFKNCKPQPAVSHQHSTSMPPSGPTLKRTHSYIALVNDMMVLMIKRTFLPQYCILGSDS